MTTSTVIISDKIYSPIQQAQITQLQRKPKAPASTNRFSADPPLWKGVESLDASKASVSQRMINVEEPDAAYKLLRSRSIEKTFQD